VTGIILSGWSGVRILKGAVKMRTIEEIKADIEKAKHCEKIRNKSRNICKNSPCKTCEFDTVSICRLNEELLETYKEAERDGRCVLLPCKKGDTVYAKTSYFSKNITETKAMFVWFDCFDFKIVCEGIGERTFGKTVFLTREEAEKALKGGAE
jgi:hypothetical protein